MKGIYEMYGETHYKLTEEKDLNLQVDSDFWSAVVIHIYITNDNDSTYVIYYMWTLTENSFVPSIFVTSSFTVLKKISGNCWFVESRFYSKLWHTPRSDLFVFRSIFVQLFSRSSGTSQVLKRQVAAILDSCPQSRIHLFTFRHLFENRSLLANKKGE